ncbi:MAG: mechanosensitive ion channel [Methanomassiliicoccales archaeon]|nr:mechanosensitive ion channel [Methanomassiliicoccales archaeon]
MDGTLELKGKTVGRVALLLIGVMLLVAMLPPSSAAPVNLFAVDDTYKKVTAGSSVTFEWVLYNNDSVPYVIMPTSVPESYTDVAVDFDQNHITLYPGGSKSLNMTVTPAAEMSSAVLTFEVQFNVTQLNAPNNTYIVNGTVQVEIIPIFGTMGEDNKILGIWDNDLPYPLDGNIGAFVVSVGIWAGIALFVILIANPLLHHVTSKTQTELDDIILKIIRGPVMLVMVLYGAVSSLEILNLNRELIAQLELMYRMAFVLVMAWLVYKIFDGVIIYYGHKLAAKTDSEVDDILVPILEKLGIIVIPVVAFGVILSLFGYDLTIILAGLGFMGIVIGYAAQATLANFFAGLQMMFDRPFKIGDLLRLDNGDICAVRNIGMRSTTLYNTFTNELAIVPNNDIANKKIVNMVQPDRLLKIAVSVGVAYGSDVELVKKLMLEAAMALPEVLKDPEHPTVVRFLDFADSSLEFTAYIWINDLGKQFKVGSDYRSELLRRFSEHKINIPFPQTVVWLKDMEKGQGQ